MAKDINPVTADPDNPRRDFYKRRPAWLLSTPAKIIIGIVILVGLVFAGRAIHHAIKSKPSGQNTGVATSNRPNFKNAPSKSSKPAGGSGQTNGSSVGATSQGPSSAASSGTPTQLANTGPGNLAVVFAVSSAVGAGTHYLYRRKQRV